MMKNNRYQKTLSAKTGKALASLPRTATAEARDPSLTLIKPENATQETLFLIWSALLRRDSFGIRENFFQLGGSSLKATQMISQIGRQLHASVSLIEVFEHPSIELLSGLIATKREYHFHQIEPASPQETYALSHAQRRLWILSQFGGGVAVYNIPLVFRLSGEINRDAFERAWLALAERHESLRTLFIEVDGEPRQKIVSTAAAGVRLKIVDVRAALNPEEQARAHADAESSAPFDLSTGPLVRATLVQLSATAHLCLLTMHHIISDGWSVRVLMNDLFSFYQSYAQGASPVPPALRIQYKDYAAWQSKLLAGEQAKAQAKYWRQQLTGDLPVLDLPTDFPRPAVKTNLGSRLSHRFSSETTGQTYQCSHRTGASLFMVLLAAINALMYRYTGMDDIIIGTPIAGREHSDLEDQIGFYVNTLALRTRFGGQESFDRLVERVKTTALEAYANQLYPFDRLVDDLELERDLSRAPLFDVMVVLHNTDVNIKNDGTSVGLSVENLSAVSEFSKFDLTFNFREIGDRLSLTLEYSTDIFSETRITQLAAHLENLLSAATRQPDAVVSSLDYISPEEKQRIVYEFNRTQRRFPRDQTVIGLFEDVAEHAPTQTAVVYDESRLTYRELNERADKLAGFLRGKLGVEDGDLLGVLLDRSDQMLITLLGIWKAGAVYVPIDPKFPAERVKYVVEDSGLRFVLSEGRHRAVHAQLPVKMILLDEQAPVIDARPPSGRVKHLSTSLAYVIYTSGSTGKPKGVEISQRSVVNFLTHMQAIPGFAVSDSLLAVTTYSFDISVLELFLPLITGGCVLIAGSAQSADGEQLQALLQSLRPTVMQATPSTWQMLLESGWAGDARLKALCGGEPLSRELGVKLLSKVGSLWNMYGPTETTIWSSAKQIQNESALNSVGTPIANTQVYILDGHQQLMPTGVAGEVCIGGEGVARGYLDRPKLTAEKFVPNPFANGERIYRTGDVGRWTFDGDIDLIGRKDFQVKVRGYRVELGEVENALRLAQPALRDALVTTGHDEGGLHLIAYLVTNAAPNVADLQVALKLRLPDYMIPSYFVYLDKLPLTPNGKINRAALPPPGDADLRGATAGDVQPRNAFERGLVEIWRHILNRQVIGISDNFFELGGHSLKATQMVSRIYKELGVKVTLRDVFLNPTIGSLAEIVASSMPVVYEGIDALDATAVTDEAPFDHDVSHAQRRLWILNQFDEQQIAYNMPSAYVLEGSLDVTAFVKACEALVARHESLRTTFISAAGEPKQRIHPYDGFPFKVEVVDLRGAPDAEAEARKQAAHEAATPFDLERGPLVRAKLLRTDREKFVVLFTSHHIISDGWSMVVLLNEALLLYNAFTHGDLNPLPPLTIQYRNYVDWQRRQLSGENLATHRRYWADQFSDYIPVLEIPGDFIRPAVKSYRGERVETVIDAALSRELVKFAQRTGTSLFMVMLGAVYALLHRYSGQDDIVVGSPVAGREHRELEEQIGFFVNMLALRIRFAATDSFITLLEKIKMVTLGAFEHQVYPFDRLVDDLQPARDTSRSPLFDVAVALQNTEIGGLRAVAIDGLGVSSFAFHNPISKFDLTFNFRETTSGLYAQLEYNSDIFKAATIVRMLDQLQMFFRDAVAAPEQKLSTMVLLTEAEQRQLLLDWNDRRILHPTDKHIHELFEAQVEKRPDEVAVVFEEQRLSYGELNRRANRLAHLLRRLGVGAEARVGMMLDRSLEMVFGLLAVLKAGGAYMPIDPRTPPERLALILSESGASVVLTQSEFAERFADFAGQLVCLDTAEHQLSGESERNVPAIAALDNLTALLYTSGSTGRPKATMIDGRGFLNLCQWYQSYYPFTENSRALLMMVFSFDAAFKNIIVPLLAGGRLVLANPGYYDAAILLRAIEENEVTFINTTPSQMYPIIELAEASEYRSLASLECLIVGGEAMILSKFRRWLNRTSPRCRLVNLYGPAECSDCVSPYQLQDDEINTIEIVPAGRAIDNARLYVLDANFNLLPVGITGELCVSGVLLARGYWQQADVTAEKFVPHPFADGERLYRTGDSARWRTDGQIEILGRMNQGQVKLRGMRVELGEVEAGLNGHSAIREAVVVVREDVPGEKRLVAYCVLESAKRQPTSSELRAFMQRALPDYMLPAHFVVLDTLPITQNGKIDRRNLPAPEECETTLPVSDTSFAPPTNDIEAQLVAVWQTVLEKPQIGITDNYFELGGDSIRVMRITARLREQGLELKVRDLFQYPTIAALAPHVKRPDARTAEQSVVVGSVPLTPALAAFVSWTVPLHRPSFGQSIALELPKGCDPEALEIIFAKIVAHHDALRLTLREEVPELFNKDAEMRVPIALFDYRVAFPPPPKLDDVLSRLYSSFDLENGPLVKLAVVRRIESDTLLFVAHQLIIDDDSWRILIEDFETLYGKYVQGEALQLAPKTDSYKKWSEHVASGSTVAGVRAERLVKLQTETELFPLTGNNPERGEVSRDNNAATLSLKFDEGVTGMLLERANNAFHTEPAELLLSALAAALAVHYGRKKFAVLLETDGRKFAPPEFNFSRTVGCFHLRYVVVLDAVYSGDSARLVKQIKESRRKAPRELIGKASGMSWQSTSVMHGAVSDPLTQIGFSFTETKMKSATFGVSWDSIHKRVSSPVTPEHEFDVRAFVTGDELDVSIKFNPECHSPERVAALLDQTGEELRHLIAFCIERETTEMTPSDFTYKELSIDDIDNIFN